MRTKRTIKGVRIKMLLSRLYLLFSSVLSMEYVIFESAQYSSTVNEKANVGLLKLGLTTMVFDYSNTKTHSSKRKIISEPTLVKFSPNSGLMVTWKVGDVVYPSFPAKCNREEQVAQFDGQPVTQSFIDAKNPTIRAFYYKCSPINQKTPDYLMDPILDSLSIAEFQGLASYMDCMISSSKFSKRVLSACATLNSKLDKSKWQSDELRK